APVLLLKNDLIDVTPLPVLAAFEGLHQRVMSGAEMLGGVLVLGGIAAADVPAGETQAEVDPGVAGLQTLFAAVRARLHVVDLIQVGAGRHGGIAFCSYDNSGR